MRNCFSFFLCYTRPYIEQSRLSLGHVPQRLTQIQAVSKMRRRRSSIVISIDRLSYRNLQRPPGDATILKSCQLQLPPPFFFCRKRARSHKHTMHFLLLNRNESSSLLRDDKGEIKTRYQVYIVVIEHIRELDRLVVWR